MNLLHCPNCEAACELFLRTHDYNRKLSAEEFDYYRCSHCSFIFLSPIPENLGAFYPAHYYEVPASAQDLDRRARQLQQWKIDLVLRHVQGGRLLEIGPAYGLFAHLAKAAGFAVTAIEMDGRCSKFLREVVGIEVVESPDTKACLAALPKFDVIVMWQVIEHLPDPWSVLEAVAQKLAPQGVLFIDTPNPQAFQFFVLGRFWTHVDAPRHVCLIPAPLLVHNLGRSGLRAQLLTAADRGANGFNGFGWAHTFKNFFASPVIGSFAHLLGRVLAKILIPVERTGWRGSTYTAVFKKVGEG